MMHCNVSRWLKDVESVKNVYFAITGSEFSCLAMNLRSLHQSSINVYHTPNLCHLNMRFLTKRHVEMNPYRGSLGSDFICSGRFSEPSCIHVCFAGMNFVFDKGHIAHKGIHDHFKSQVFANKQGWQTIYARRIQRQAWQFCCSCESCFFRLAVWLSATWSPPTMVTEVFDSLQDFFPTPFFKAASACAEIFLLSIFWTGVNSLKEWRAVAAGTFNCLQAAARPFDASDPTMCLYEMTFLPMTGRTSAAVSGGPGAPATVARLGRGKKAASFRFRLTATKKRPPWICAFAEGFLYVFFEAGRLQAAFAFADGFLLSTGFFWDVARQESISKTPGAKSSFTFFEALPKPSQNESFCKCHPRSHGTVQRCGQQNLAALSQMHSRQFSWNLACLVHGLLAFVLGRECMRIASWYLGLVGLYSCSMSKTRTKNKKKLQSLRGTRSKLRTFRICAAQSVSLILNRNQTLTASETLATPAASKESFICQVLLAASFSPARHGWIVCLFQVSQSSGTSSWHSFSHQSTTNLTCEIFYWPQNSSQLCG